MNDLEKFFSTYDGPMLHKWHHYFEIYDRHFSRFRNTDVRIVEFGVSQGGSIEMWRHYFGPQAEIVGVDINPECARFERPRVRIVIGDQEDREFLASLRQSCPRIDILIDDGGHTMRQQIATFEELFPHVSENGVYLVEDLHTSYWPRWGGGYRKRGTFIEYSKNFVDQINAWHSKDPALRVTEFTKTAGSLHFYDSVLVIEKRRVAAPTHERRGQQFFPDYEHRSPRLIDKLRSAVRPRKRAKRGTG